MKKVTTTEKVFIIGTMSLIGGCTAELADAGLRGAFCIGAVFGILGTAIIGLLHRIRS